VGSDDLSRSTGRTRRRLAIVATLVLLVVVFLLIQRSRSGRSLGMEYVVLLPPGVALDSEELGRIHLALDANGPLPSGIAVVRFGELRGAVGWDGRRDHVIEVLAPPGELVAVTLHRDGREEQRVEPSGDDTQLELPVEVPFWGDHAYVITVELSRGEREYDFELYGTVSVGSLGLRRVWRSLDALWTDARE
jgi:hypothetical protein